MPAPGHAGADAIDTARQEQDWNRRQLERPVQAAAFRVWNHRKPAVVLGCSQRSWSAGAALHHTGRVALLKRATGGGAVLTGPWMVSVSVILPPDHAWVGGGVLEAYRQLSRVHTLALAGLGVETHAVPPDGVRRANQRLDGGVSWACFGSLAPWELTDRAGRKLVGMAQRRQNHGVLLVAGTLCHPPDWPLLCEAMGFPGDAPRLHRITAPCDALAVRAFGADTLAETLGRALTDGLSAPGDASRVACRSP